MSLEAKIDALTSAVLGLTYALNQHAAIAPIPTLTYEDAMTKVVSKVVKEREAEIVEEEIADSKKSKTTTDTSPPSEPESAAVSYDDVKKATNALSAAKGRDVTIAALAHFGVDRATQLVEAQWGDYINFTKEQALL